MMNNATRDSFLAPVKCKTSEFDCAIGRVRMRELSGSDYSKHLVDWLRPKGKLDKAREAVMWSRLVVLCVVDENGDRLLTDDDVAAVEAMPKSVLNLLHKEALTLHGQLEPEEDDDFLEPSGD